MPQLRQYPQATSLLETDALWIDRVSSGTMYITGASLLFPITFLSVAALRANTYLFTAQQPAELTAFFAGGTSGGGQFIAVPTDTTTADNGVTIFVDVAGNRWYRQNYGYIFPEMGGAVGNGTADDTAVLQACINLGPTFLTALKNYAITHSLIIPTNGVLIGAGRNVSTIKMLSSGFTNTSNTSGRYATNAVGINASGLTTAPYTAKEIVRLENFTLQSQVLAGRVLRGIVVLNTNNLQIRNVEVYGLPTGIGICVASIGGNSIIEDVDVHDMTDNTNWGSVSPALVQITGIEVDNDIVNSVVSNDFQINNPFIKDITLGSTAIGLYGYQTDGINIANTNTANFQINNPIIVNVGEGIDCFGKHGAITNPVISDCYNFCLKLIHGASYISVSGGVLMRGGLANLYIGGSTISGSGDTSHNVITGVTMSQVDPNSVWSASSSADVLITDNTGTYGKPVSNLIVGCSLDPGANGKYGWLDSSTGSNNRGKDLTILTGAALSRLVLIQNSAGFVDGADYLAAEIPTASTILKGAWGYVSNATAPTYGATIAGAGAVYTRFLCNGSAMVTA